VPTKRPSEMQPRSGRKRVPAAAVGGTFNLIRFRDTRQVQQPAHSHSGPRISRREYIGAAQREREEHVCGATADAQHCGEIAPNVGVRACVQHGHGDGTVAAGGRRAELSAPWHCSGRTHGVRRRSQRVACRSVGLGRASLRPSSGWRLQPWLISACPQSHRRKRGSGHSHIDERSVCAQRRRAQADHHD